MNYQTRIMAVFFLNITSGNCGLQTCYHYQHLKAKKFDGKITFVELSLILAVILCVGVADVFCKNVDISRAQTVEDGIVKINVTQELISQVAKQRKLETEEEYRQQRGNGGGKEMVMPSAGGHNRTLMQKRGKVLPTHIKHHNSSVLVSKGQKSNSMVETLSDSPKPTTDVGKSVTLKEPCQPMPPAILRQILGAAFNPRYMSIDTPDWAKDDDNKPTDEEKASVKTGQQDQEWSGSKPRRKLESFQVHSSYTRILHEEPIPNIQGDSEHIDVLINSVESGEETKPFEVIELESDKDNKHKSKRHRNLHQRRKHRQHGRQGQHNPNNRTRTDLSESLNHTRSGARHHTVPQSSADVDFKAKTFDQVEPQIDGYQSDYGTTLRRSKRQATGADKFISLVRKRRAPTSNSGLAWTCKSRIEWIDLGPNHFPRFLRSVVCTSEFCWYNFFQCRPKAFTVKILRRRKDSCNPDVNDKTEGQPEGLIDLKATVPPPFQGEVFNMNSLVPHEFREQWVFEERAVTFCCECAS